METIPELVKEQLKTWVYKNVTILHVLTGLVFCLLSVTCVSSLICRVFFLINITKSINTDCDSVKAVHYIPWCSLLVNQLSQNP